MENKELKWVVPTVIIIVSAFYFVIMFFCVGQLLEPLGEKSKQRFISFIWGFIVIFIVLSLILGTYRKIGIKAKWFDIGALIFFFVFLGYLFFELFIPHNKSLIPDDKTYMFVLGIAFSGVYFYLVFGCLNLMGIGDNKNTSDEL